MNVPSVARPLGCLKAACRKARLAKAATRSISTTTPREAIRQAHSAQQRLDILRAARFAIPSPAPKPQSLPADPMPALLQQQIAKLDPTGARTRMFSKDHADSAKVGDVLMVTPKSGEPFAGAFLQIRRRGVDTAILLRGQLMKTSTEMWFKIYSPMTTAINIIWRRPKRARRARLTYMRKPKHDMGSVDQLVFKWKKERYALRSKAAAKQQQPAKKA